MKTFFSLFVLIYSAERAEMRRTSSVELSFLHPCILHQAFLPPPIASLLLSGDTRPMFIHGCFGQVPY